ncbi:hypothetical protein [Paenibacillus alba]|uniref:Peptidase n=1 Tax=Paenibacillus alba TaxID=1197127 RepID=A0ABU6GAQ7_9BACL|nr:hypothetical protein [Paenibacillus alba]MEC0231276.1 hypothetical protein [Paenibacillus alba]
MVILQPCDVIFVTRKRKTNVIDRIIERIVRWATGSEIFHVAYFISGEWAFEANSFRAAGDVSLTSYAEYSVKRLNLPNDVRERILNRILQTRGSKYGWIEALSLVAREKLGLHIYYDNPKKFICSEIIVQAVLEETGIRLTPKGAISPADLWQSPYLFFVAEYESVSNM